MCEGKIIIISDQKDPSHDLKEVLLEAGFTVTTVGNKESSYLKVKEGLPDMIIFNIDACRANSLALLSKIRMDWDIRDTPSLFVNSVIDSNMQDMITLVSCAGYMKSPVKTDDLIERATQLTTMSRLKCLARQLYRKMDSTPLYN